MKLHEWLERSLRRPIYAGTGRLIALDAGMFSDATRSASIVRQINRLSQVPLTLEDVHIRGMNAANNVIDYYESRFTEKGLRQASKLYSGTAMAAGHDMSRTPLATVFDGDVLEPTGGGTRVRELRDVGQATWLRGLWYVPRSLSWAQDLVTAVDTGVQREVSLHWYFTEAICGLCDADLRTCDHYPGEVYDGKKCWYEMEGVTDIVETSFVIKGGQRGTSLWNPAESRQAIEFGRAIRELKSDRQAFADWKRLDPSSGVKKSRSGNTNGAARWLGSGLTRV